MILIIVLVSYQKDQAPCLMASRGVRWKGLSYTTWLPKSIGIGSRVPDTKRETSLDNEIIASGGW